MHQPNLTKMRDETILIQDVKSIKAFKLAEVAFFRNDTKNRNWIMVDISGNETLLFQGINYESILNSSNQLFQVNLNYIVNLEYLIDIKSLTVILKIADQKIEIPINFQCRNKLLNQFNIVDKLL